MSKEKQHLKIGTLNVKNIETNEAYVRELLATYDILAVQEHWLFTFQLSNFESYFTSQATFLIVKSLMRMIHSPLLRSQGGMGGLPPYTGKTVDSR